MEERMRPQCGADVSLEIMLSPTRHSVALLVGGLGLSHDVCHVWSWKMWCQLKAAAVEHGCGWRVWHHGWGVHLVAMREERADWAWRAKGVGSVWWSDWRKSWAQSAAHEMWRVSEQSTSHEVIVDCLRVATIEH